MKQGIRQLWRLPGIGGVRKSFQSSSVAGSATVTMAVMAAMGAGSAYSNIVGTGAASLAAAIAAGAGTVTTPSSGDAPIILGTDIVAGPNTGGEDNKGTYIRVFGYNLGTFSGYTGGSNHLTIGGVEVDNYRYLQPAVGTVGSILGIDCLCAQIGSLSGLSAGVNYAVSVTVGGVGPQNDSSGGHYLDADGNPIDFMINPGPIVFVSHSGNDANSGTISSPLRHLQTYNGSSQFSGAVYGPVSGRTTSNQIVPGTTIVIRGDSNYGADTSFENRWCNFFRVTGTAPTGSVNTGYITIMSYPGAAGANSPETAQWHGGSGSAGGFQYADTSRASESTPWGTTGYGKYIALSSLDIQSYSGSTDSSAAPINRQSAADYSRVVNCELSMPQASGSPLAAGVAGYGSYGQNLFNYIHDVYDPSGSLQNHGFYIDNNASVTGAGSRTEYHSVYAYNTLHDITGGSGFNVRGVTSGGTADSAPWISIHHNWMDTIGKHGVNTFDGRPGVRVHSNVMFNIQYSPISIQNGPSGTYSCYYGYNTAYAFGLHSPAYPAIYTNASAGAGSIMLQGNVFIRAAGAPTPAWDAWIAQISSAMSITYSKNDWYDVDTPARAKPSGDTAGFNSNPQLTSPGTEDFTPGASSPLLDAGTGPQFSIGKFDLFGALRPQDGNTNWTMGPIERVA